MKRTKSRKTTDEIRGYLLQISGSRDSAERTAGEWNVRIRVIEELSSQDETFAVCPAADLAEIRAWHAECMPSLQAGERPQPGDLMRIELPPEDVDTAFPEENHPHGLRLTRPRRVKFDEL